MRTLGPVYNGYTVSHYRPQTKLREGYVFTGVCDSVNRGGGYPIMPCTTTTSTPQGWRPPLGWRTHPPPYRWSMCGWYASYWNAFLFTMSTLEAVDPGFPRMDANHNGQIITKGVCLSIWSHVLSGEWVGLFRGVGMSMVGTPLPDIGYSQQAGSMHPTLMLSCLAKFH